MERFIFHCPRTGRAIDAGFQTNKPTLAAVASLRLKLYCPYCRTHHELPMECAHPAGPDMADSPKPAALSIALNALRIHLLREGLN